ncbi:Arv1-like family-domain-containing protein [Kockovaella imperatae]|uniref:Protein ARV n=1 Tax=Kockovaella imperatae TaxID=4999 RepID=A0A1Y1UJL0_9TREE|nr:Arv1-like family-domain-containing protein [Kockovaella imperatae]ORX37656.1 Arv1-like family-domain-containing protein [Kockovaella imperatae]
MPVCTNCAAPADHLYTTYRTASNIRLTVCNRCNRFADPLIEHPSLILLLDLILLKPRVFLHLLFNRGSAPFEAGHSSQPRSKRPTDVSSPERQATQRSVQLWATELWLGSIIIAAETLLNVLSTLRAVSQNDHGPLSLLNRETTSLIFIAASGVIVEILAQHLTTVALTLLCLAWRGWYPTRGKMSNDGRRDNFQPILVSLTLCYTAVLPLLLQLFLSIWYNPSSHHEYLPTASPPALLLPTFIRTIEQLVQSQMPSSSVDAWSRFILPALTYVGEVEQALLDLWYASDRIWIGTRLLGGMSAGFGLRVLLPTSPLETTGVVLAGWTAGDLGRRLLGLERRI